MVLDKVLVLIHVLALVFEPARFNLNFLPWGCMFYLCYLFVSVAGHQHFLQCSNCSIFGKLDINGDGELDEVEFIGGCLDDSELVRLLNGSKVFFIRLSL